MAPAATPMANATTATAFRRREIEWKPFQHRDPTDSLDTREPNP